MHTRDGTEIIDHLRVWVEGGPATVDLARACPDGRLVVRTDTGRAVEIDADQATATIRGLCSRSPPQLGRCRWIHTCDQIAVRMHPHPLMSPVAVCPRCISAYSLQ